MSNEPPPLRLSLPQIQKIYTRVRLFFPHGYDHEFIADTIIVQAWLNGLDHVSQSFVRHKCIDAWRERRRELRRNETATEIRRHRHLANPDLHPTVFADRKARVEEAVECLGPYERRLIWMKFYDDQTLMEIAESVGRSREEIQQTIKTALYKMRIQLT